MWNFPRGNSTFLQTGKTRVPSCLQNRSEVGFFCMFALMVQRFSTCGRFARRTKMRDLGKRPQRLLENGNNRPELENLCSTACLRERQHIRGQSRRENLRLIFITKRKLCRAGASFAVSYTCQLDERSLPSQVHSTSTEPRATRGKCLFASCFLWATIWR